MRIRIVFSANCGSAENAAFKRRCYGAPWGKLSGTTGEDINTGTTAMRFLLRAAFWFGIVMLLLPAFRSPDSGRRETAPVGAVDAATAATATFSDMLQFCTRQPGACAVGAQVATAAGQRAQAGAKLLYEMLSEKIATADPESAVSSPGGGRREQLAASVKNGRDTLTDRDLAPEWRGPGRSKDASQKRTPSES